MLSSWSISGDLIFEFWGRTELLDPDRGGWWRVATYAPPMGALEFLNFLIGELHRDF